MRDIFARLSTLAILAGVAILAYVCVGTGSTGGGLGILVSLALLLVGLWRARQDPEQAAITERIGSRALLLLPGAALVYLAFEAGGFFPRPPALVAVVFGLILAARLTTGSAAIPGSRLVRAVFAALALYAGWVLLSGGWSHSFERAVAEADLAVVYGLGFVLFATAVTGPGDLRWVMRGVALGAAIVGGGAFLSRVLPELWPIAATLDTSRISYPLTYWNALGLLAALGIILCVGLTSDDREPRLLKALAAVPVPLLAATLLLTFSRGAIAAGIVGLIAYVILGRPSSLLSAAVAVVPPTALALHVTYGATSLAKTLDRTPVQASDGRHVALVVGACMLAAGVARLVLSAVDAPLRGWLERHPVGPGAARGIWGALVVVALVVGIAAGMPRTIDTQYGRFVHGAAGHAQLRDRLTDATNDGRLPLWRVGLREFDAAPVAGRGAGTFEPTWYAHRPAQQGQVTEAHSIYVENLDELGIVGFGLLACVLLGSLIAIGSRLRGADRPLHAVVFAAVLAWMLHAGIDWDWEMPAVSLPIFILAGAALARGPQAAGRPDRRAEPGATPRAGFPLAALAVLAVACVPALVDVSQAHLDKGLAALAANDCPGATDAAHSALAPLGFRHAPHEILAVCHAARGEHEPAATEMAAAVREDPANWETHYGMAVVLAAIGRDPRPAVRAALVRNPQEPLILALAEQFRRNRRSQWPADAAAAPLPIGGRYGTSIAALRAAGATGGGRASR